MKTTFLKNIVQHGPSASQHIRHMSFAKLAPALKEQEGDIRRVITSKVVNAATRSITDALVDPESQSYQGQSYAEVSDTVSAAIRATMKNPIHLPSQENTLYTSHAVLRRMGKETYEVKDFTDILVSKGEQFSTDTVIRAIEQAHKFSFTPSYQKALDDFNKRHPGYQAYDMQRIIAREKELEKQGLHRIAPGEEDVSSPEKVYLMRFMERLNRGTEKDIAADIFDRKSFSAGKSETEIMQYTIGTWAGAIATGFKLALTAGKNDKKFMGWEEASVWLMARMAVAGVHNESFRMPADTQGNHTRENIANAYANSVLFASNALLQAEQHPLNQNANWYFNNPSEGSKAIEDALKGVYQQSLRIKESQISR